MIALVVISYIGVFAYLITQGRGIAERNVKQSQQARNELRRVVGFILQMNFEKRDRPAKKAGLSVAPTEYARTQVVQ